MRPASTIRPYSMRISFRRRLAALISFSGAAGLVVAALLYLAFTVLVLHPDPLSLGSTIAPDPGDPVFNLTILKWVAEEWREGLPNDWNLPFFYPTKGTLTLSDHLLGPAAVVAALAAAGVDEITSYNLLFLSSFVFCGLATFWVLRQTGLSWAAAFAGGLIFAFSPYRMEQRSHLQVLLACFVPLVLYGWDRFLAEPGARRGFGFLLPYLLHLSGGNYLAYMIHLPMAAILAVRLNEVGGLRRLLDHRRTLLVVGLACGLALAAVFGPYLLLSPDLRLERGEGEWRAFGATLLSFIAPSVNYPTFPDVAFPLVRLENCLTAGLLPSFLALAGLVVLRRRSEHHQGATPWRWPEARATVLLLLSLALLALLLADLRTWTAGTPLQTNEWLRPLKYHKLFLLFVLAVAFAYHRWRRGGGTLGWPFGGSTWERGLLASGAVSLLLCLPIFFSSVARLLPGLDRMRVPTRFYVFVSLAVAYLAAVAIDWLRQRFAGARGFALSAGLVGLLALELAPNPMSWNRLPTAETLDPVYGFLAAQQDVTAVLELPAGDVVSDIFAIYAQTFHRQPLINGYSGHLPPDYLALVQCCGPGVPDAQTVERFRAQGISHLLIRPPRHWGKGKRLALDRIDHLPGVERIYRQIVGPRQVVVVRLAPP